MVFGGARRLYPWRHEQAVHFTVDYIVTPGEVISCGRSHRPSGVFWTGLDREKIAAIPVLAAMADER